MENKVMIGYREPKSIIYAKAVGSYSKILF